jgi:hypothetical protein
VQVGAGYVLRSRGAVDRPVDGVAPAAVQYHLADFDARSFYEPSPSRADLVFSAANALQFPTDPTSFVGPTTPGSLTRYPASGDGDFTASSNDQVIEGLDIYGSVRLLAYSGVTIRNCIIRGTLVTGQNTAFVVASNEDLRGAVIEDCELVGRGNMWVEGIRGSNYTIRRCELHGMTDGISLTSQGGNVQVLGNWIHDCLYSEWDSTTPNMPTQGSYYMHCDAIQFHRGKDYVIRGNYLGGVRAADPSTGAVWNHHTGHLSDIQAADDFYNSCILLKQEVDSTQANKIERVLIEQNVFNGGVASLNHPSSNGNDFSSTTIRDNQFVPLPYAGTSFYILKSPSLLTVMSNNTFTTGGAVPISNGGG